jgi:hypothetical protein
VRGLRALLAVCALALVAGTAGAEGWSRFYVPTQRPVASVPDLPAAGVEGVCIREILAAQTRHAIPFNLLLAIGLQEAGTRRNGHFTVWPYAVNAAGTGRLFDNRTAAMDWVHERQAAGIASIDVGCMQINLRWHPEAFASVAEGFDPRANVDYAARFLKRLHGQTGDWMQAAGAYHSFEPEFRDLYLARLERNIEAANAGLPKFAALAGAAGTAQPAPVRARETATPRAAGVQVARATWGAGIGGQANARTSIYSAQEIRPILPVFTTVHSEDAG